jgi:hypothetical protein
MAEPPSRASDPLEAEWHPFAVEDDREVLDRGSQDFLTALGEAHVPVDELRPRAQPADVWRPRVNA